MERRRRIASILLAAWGLSACTMGPTPTGQPFNVTLPDLTTYALVRTDAGEVNPTVVTVAAAAEVLARYDVIFIGEAHRHPANHLAEMALYRAIQERAGTVALSMEQFERDVQPIVDDYLAGKIGENAFLEKSRPWNNYTTSYRPLVEYAKDHHLAVIAANAPENVVRCIGLEGADFLKRMKPEQRGWAAAELHLGEGTYRNKFLGFVGTDAGHGGDPNADKTAVKKEPSESALRSFAAQVVRDDTMAESIARYLQAHPDAKVVHINGSFHSDSFLGTPERLKMRMPNLKIAVVSPTEPDHPERPTLSDDDAKAGTFVLMIRNEPEPYANDDEMKAAIKEQVAARTKTKCEL